MSQLEYAKDNNHFDFFKMKYSKKSNAVKKIYGAIITAQLVMLTLTILLINKQTVSPINGNIYNEEQVAEIINETAIKAEQKILYLDKLNNKSDSSLKLLDKSVLIQTPAGLISSDEISCIIHIKNNDNKDNQKITGFGNNLQKACENAITNITK